MKTHSVTILVIIYPQNRRRSHPDPHQMSEQIALRASRFMVSQACIPFRNFLSCKHEKEL